MNSPHPAIRLLACDMDGTLFRQDLVISTPVREAISRAQAAGVIVVLATGRMPAAARPFIGMLGLTGPQIYANGALIQTVGGETLYHLPVESAVASDVVEFGDDRGFHVNAYTGDDVYVRRLGPEAEFTRKLNRVNPIVIDDLKAFVRDHPPTKMVVVRLPSVEAGLLSEIAVAFQGRLLVSSSVPQYVEMVNPQVDKGCALNYLLTQLGLRRDQVAAVGDADNDLTLLGAAGLPIAMGNGTARLKSLARHVVGTVEQDGVAEAIDKFIIV